MLIHPKYIAGAVAFMTLAVSGLTWAQPHDGFEGARWGMSMQQVQSAFSGRLVSFTPPGDDASSPKFGFPHYDVDGCNFEVDFKFENEHLVRVDLVLISDSMDAAECPTKIAENLTTKYGAPVIDEPSREMYSPRIPPIDWAGRTEGRGNAGQTANSFFHPSDPSGFSCLIPPKSLI